MELYVNARLDACHSQKPSTDSKTVNNQAIPRSACYQYHLGMIQLRFAYLLQYEP